MIGYTVLTVNGLELFTAPCEAVKNSFVDFNLVTQVQPKPTCVAVNPWSIVVLITII